MIDNYHRYGIIIKLLQFMRCTNCNDFAGMAELADAPDLGSGVPDVQVQVLLPAVIKWLKSRLFGVRVA